MTQRYASIYEHPLTVAPVKTRRLCRLCSCRRRATHAVFAMGMAMSAPGCELATHRIAKQMRAVAARGVMTFLFRPKE